MYAVVFSLVFIIAVFTNEKKTRRCKSERRYQQNEADCSQHR